MSNLRVSAVALAMGIAIVGAFSIVNWSNPNRTAKREKSAFELKFERVAIGMPEATVDHIMQAIPHIVMERRDETRVGHALVRPSVKTKFYEQKVGATEGDLFAEFYFDDTGMVVGRRLGVYCN